jgi:hypothetical protein
VPVAGDAYMPAPEPRPSPEQALASQAVPWTASEPDPIPPVPAEEAPREAVAPTPLPQAAVPQDTPPNADPARSASLPPERAPDAVPWAGATPQWTGIRRRRRPPPASTPAPSAPSRLAAEATTHPSLFAADSRLPALVLAPVATPPSFVQRAERAARWQSPAWRAGLATTALLLWLALGVQASLFNRNLLASRWPVLQPALTALCAPLACEVGAPSMIDQWVLNSSRLARTPRADVLQLVAELHNHADLALRKPALDVSFTDASGQLIARKVLLPTQLGDPQVASVAANAPWTVDLRLQTPSLNITGFTIEVFYP